ncbi:MAG: ATP-dependent zinc protease [Gammaproteobacteria bacterium]|nr:MAG: ATP-dependent zinc protease [Gammaproteobacteria bacterium]
MKTEQHQLLIGWREWIALPQLELPHIKVKVDTGARTSALHAYFVESFYKDDQEWVRFGVHPLQRNTRLRHVCTAPVIDKRWVSDSGGHREQRYVISTDIKIADHVFNVEVTLTNRDTMIFRMLLGRTALKNRFVVDPSRSYLLGEYHPSPVDST